MNVFLPTSTSLSINKIFGRRGFTLIELLVVISIISILATIGIATYQGAQKNARDARRRNDVDVIAKSLETNKVQSSLYYPTISATWFESGAVPQDTTTAKYCVLSRSAGTIVVPTQWLSTTSCPTAAEADGLTTVSAIPLAGGVPAASYSIFKICARLEQGTQPNIFCRSNIQ